MNSYKLLATLVLTFHALWTLLIIFGYLVARNRQVLRWIHIGLLCYGVFIEVAPFPCPLTLAEQWLETQAGIMPYQQPFLVHYLEAVIYPDIPEAVLVSCAAVVFAVNLGLYGRLWVRRRRKRRSHYPNPRPDGPDS
jgi:hypothetical protein